MIRLIQAKIASDDCVPIRLDPDRALLRIRIRLNDTDQDQCVTVVAGPDPAK